MKLKICRTCKKEKCIDQFTKDKSRKDSLKINCSVCCIEYSKNYTKNNPEKEKDRRKRYNSIPENRESRLKWKNKYYHDNKEKINARRKEIRKINTGDFNKKRKEDTLKYLNTLIGNRIRDSLRRSNYKKINKTTEILGCSISDFKIYLESKFESWMTWENWGKFNGDFNVGWDIDHIIPISSVKTEDAIIKLNHYSNLQPLDSYINRYIKSNNIMNWIN